MIVWIVVFMLYGFFIVKVDMFVFVDLVNGLSNWLIWLFLGVIIFWVFFIKWYINFFEFSVFYVWDLVILKESKEIKLVIIDLLVFFLVYVIG